MEVSDNDRSEIGGASGSKIECGDTGTGGEAGWREGCNNLESQSSPSDAPRSSSETSQPPEVPQPSPEPPSTDINSLPDVSQTPSLPPVDINSLPDASRGDPKDAPQDLQPRDTVKDAEEGSPQKNNPSGAEREPQADSQGAGGAPQGRGDLNNGAGGAPQGRGDLNNGAEGGPPAEPHISDEPDLVEGLKYAWKHGSPTDKVEIVATGIGMGAQTIPYAGDYVALGASTVSFIVKPSGDKAGDVALDAVGAILPGVPALGTIHQAEKITEAASAANKVEKAVNAVNNTERVINTARKPTIEMRLKGDPTLPAKPGDAIVASRGKEGKVSGEKVQSHDYIRVMPGNPADPLLMHQNPYVHLRENGKTIGIDDKGNRVVGLAKSSTEIRPSFSEWSKWKDWHKP